MKIEGGRPASRASAFRGGVARPKTLGRVLEIAARGRWQGEQTAHIFFVIMYTSVMAKTGVERQKSYRGRRKAAGLCATAGCPELADAGHAQCAAHLEGQRRTARQRTADAANFRAAVRAKGL